MPPRLGLFNARSSYLKAWPARLTVSPASSQPAHQRWITADEKPLPTNEQPKGPNQEQLPHVSEEAVAVEKAMGGEGPDIGQGTPVQEILQRDSDGQNKAPKVIQEEIKHSKAPGGSRSYSTSSRRSSEGLETTHTPAEMELPPQMTFRDIPHELGGEGHKFGLPEAPLARTDHLKRRYDPVVDQLTKKLMRSGKLSYAQRVVSDILDTLRTAPPPQNKSSKPGQALLPSAGPINLLPLSPIKYLTAVFDSLAPLIKIRQERGMAGGGRSLPIPVPIGIKLRRRTAMGWIVESSAKRTETKLADRVAREIIGVAEGTSSAWDKRQLLHKQAVTARANLKVIMAPTRGR